jgi:hypothetical protein
MKKFWLSLGLALILACWSGVGYYGFGTCPAFGQLGYYDGNVTCDPNDPYCYNDYYAAPTVDPLSQYLFYVAPPVVVEGGGYGGYRGHEGGRGGGGREGGGHGGGSRGGGGGGGKEGEHKR